MLIAQKNDVLLIFKFPFDKIKKRSFKWCCNGLIKKLLGWGFLFNFLI